mmetsp:Transcript_10981/g.19393  ORF Transcript_10981/g.19393 Transcript_10981/m.19393 type:complete len:279 (+) Transcript_10981:282-1118(+)
MFFSEVAMPDQLGVTVSIDCACCASLLVETLGADRSGRDATKLEPRFERFETGISLSSPAAARSAAAPFKAALWSASTLFAPRFRLLAASLAASLAESFALRLFSFSSSLAFRFASRSCSRKRFFASRSCCFKACRSSLVKRGFFAFFSLFSTSGWNVAQRPARPSSPSAKVSARRFNGPVFRLDPESGAVAPFPDAGRPAPTFAVPRTGPDPLTVFTPPFAINAAFAAASAAEDDDPAFAAAARRAGELAELNSPVLRRRVAAFQRFLTAFSGRPGR